MTDLCAQVSRGLVRRSDAFLEDVFKKYKDPNSNSILHPHLQNALYETKVSDSDECDVSRYDGKPVDSKSFKKLANKASDLDQWAQSLPLWQLLSDSIPRIKGVSSFRIYFDMRY